MSDDNRKMRQAENTVPVQGSRSQSPDLTRRRLVVKAAVSAVPVVMTLRSGAAMASAGNCAAIPLTPTPIKDTDGATTSWSFVDIAGTDQTPYMVGNEVQCVMVDLDNNCPTATASPPFNDSSYQISEFRCQSGIIVQASSGGSFTHNV